MNFYPGSNSSTEDASNLKLTHPGGLGGWFSKTKFGQVWYGTFDDWDKNSKYKHYLFSGDFVK